MSFETNGYDDSSRQFGEHKKKLDVRERLDFLLNATDIKLPKDVLERLMLLDTERRVHGELYSSKNEEMHGAGKNGVEVVKKIGTHLEHTVNLMEILDVWLKIFPEEWQQHYSKKILTAAALHDIGKTGPANADKEAQKAFSKLFSFYTPDAKEGKAFGGKPVFEAVNDHALAEEKEEIVAALRRIGITEQTKMGDIFAAHLDNTYGILNNPGFDPEITFLAASHHRGLHNYPYHTTDEQIDALLGKKGKTTLADLKEAATMIELADNVEARGGRGVQKSLVEVLPPIQVTFTEKLAKIVAQINNSDISAEEKERLTKQEDFVKDAIKLIKKMLSFYSIQDQEIK